MNNKTLLLSMEKAGSTTIMRAVDHGLMIPVDRLHRNNEGSFKPEDYGKFIIPVRDPIARAISEKFEVAQTGMQFSYTGLAPWPLLFMNGIVKKFFGKNFLASAVKFDRKKGYSIYASRYGDILIIRTDRLSDSLAEALGKLYDAPASRFMVRHLAKGKDRFEGYDIDSIKFDVDFLNEIYGSPYAKKYFYAKEIKEMVEKWKQPSPP